MRTHRFAVSGWRAALALLGVGAILGAIALGTWLRRPPEVWTFSGQAMADSYQVTIVDPPRGVTREQCRRAVAESLERIDALFSTYKDDSEVVRFGKSASLDWQPVSRQTADATALALDIGLRGSGAYDITIAPLVDLWGFGPERRPAARPAPAEIRERMALVGPDKVEVRLNPPALRKKRAGVRIDLSSVGQGYGVDQAADALEKLGVTRYFIDFSGEIRARGKNARGTDWRVGVEAPIAGQQQVQELVPLAEGALATSGDYRNYIEVDGVRFCHILDARTGYPISHKLASVTVWDRQSCARADAWATALLVAGPDEGYDIAKKEGLRAMFIIREETGFTVKWTDAR